ncbi:MAG: phospholipase D-like domain-containing protein [Bacteroidales bacterium]|jgi:cardiolipin synthase|nr:phospholipase D-like domain-containing protein [Bacteroidales bacterium]
MKTIFKNDEKTDYILYASSTSWLSRLLQDIENAKSYIYIETFRLRDDAVGRSLLTALARKAQQGIEVKLLVDAFGTPRFPMLSQTAQKGVDIRFFKRLVFLFPWFWQNHERTHRKIALIDHQLLHIGSANYTEYGQQWRESILRIENEALAQAFKKIFLTHFSHYRKKFNPLNYYKIIHVDRFCIIRETPSIIHQKAKNYFLQLIREAKETIMLISPYFVTGSRLLTSLSRAVKRGVKVTIVIPEKSDVRAADYVRDIFLKNFYKKGIYFQMFTKGNIHAKLLCVDEKIFSIGSTNFDYRSFRYMHEINLAGEDPDICSLIVDYLKDTLSLCVPFDLKKWQNRPLYQKCIGWLLYPVRKLL